VVIHSLKKGEDPDQETVRDAAELALRFSKAKDICNEGEVTVSQVKFLHRCKGSPGKVQISKHRVIHIRLDSARWNRLNLLL
jgi:predicted ribosome quality control (RQC) complex YloA/Tae2 family protein